jgi:hypothetical protein
MRLGPASLRDGRLDVNAYQMNLQIERSVNQTDLVDDIRSWLEEPQDEISEEARRGTWPRRVERLDRESHGELAQILETLAIRVESELAMNQDAF